MRIDDPKSVRNTTALKKKSAANSASGTGFQSLLETNTTEEAHTTKPPSLSSVSPMTSFIVSGWEANEEEQEKSKAYGEQILKELEALRYGLLNGSIGASTASRLLQSITRNRPTFIEPRLQEIIDDIELRAAVEAAKLDRAE